MIKQEPLLNGALEKQRLIYMYKTHVITPETDTSGVGDVTDPRLAETIKLNVDTFNLPNTPAMTDIFSRSFLPVDAKLALRQLDLVRAAISTPGAEQRLRGRRPTIDDLERAFPSPAPPRRSPTGGEDPVRTV